MLMPQMGESISEATVSKWRKNVGDSVQKDEIILEISTDKVDSEIPAPASGVLSEILFQEGQVVPVKTKIAVIDSEGSANNTTKSAAPAAASPAPTKEAAKAAPVVAESTHSEQDSSRFYSPLVKSLAEKHAVSLQELDTLKGSGAADRVTKEDLLNYIESKKQAPAAAAPRVSVSAPRVESAAKQAPITDWGADGTKVVQMDTMRMAIADHMVRSKSTSPHVYSVTEVDVTNISKWRKANKSKFEAKEGFNLSFTPFFLEAAVQGLMEFPGINVSVDKNKIIMKRHINLGCAVALGKTGLIVPVIKKAEEKNLVGLARSLNDLAARARNKKLLPDDVAGGTFTVTNPGVFGTLIGYPIINQPQVAILSLGAIKKRPVVIDDMIAIREMMYISMSYDHRVVDGSLGGSFLSYIRDYLEKWDMERPLY